MESSGFWLLVRIERLERRRHPEFGLLVGTSTGTNVTAALHTAQKMGRKAKVVTVSCNRAERYFRTRLFDD